MSKTDRDTLLALAERVEGLSNSDRRTDLEIMCQLDLRPHWLRKSEGYMWVDDSGHHSIIRWADERIGEAPGNPGVDDGPKFTASLDAAKTLVPKGWHVGMLTECDEDDSPSCCLTQNEEPCQDAVGRGADMALSLVAAALRARAGGL